MARPRAEISERGHIAVLMVCVAILGAAAVLRISSGRTSVVLPGTGTVLPDLCIFHAASGLPCPGCGMTRSFVALMHGQLSAALTYHPVGPLIALWVAMQIPLRCFALLQPERGERLLHSRMLEFVPKIVVVLLLLAWTVRIGSLCVRHLGR